MSSFSAPSYSSFVPSQPAGNGFGPLKTSALVSLTFGLVSSGVYYLYLRASKEAASSHNQLDIVKRELVKELRQRSFDPPKDQDYTFPMEFMVYLYKQLYTYQTIAREVLKEQIFERRVTLLKEGKLEEYKETLESRQTDFTKIQSEIKEIVFDYFNIITKEYELSYEKWRADKDYQEQIAQIKTQVDEDFVDRKFDAFPESLTIEKTKEIMQRKQEAIDGIFMRMVSGLQPDAEGKVMIGQSQLVFEIAKFDDEVFINDGVRKEHVDAAIKKYGISSKDDRKTPSEEEARKIQDFMNSAGSAKQPAHARPVVPESNPALSRSTGKTINLD